MSADDHITYEQRRCIGKICDQAVQLNDGIDAFTDMIDTGVAKAGNSLLDLIYLNGSDKLWQQLHRLDYLERAVVGMMLIDATLLYCSAVETIRKARSLTASQAVVAQMLGAVDNDLQSLCDLVETIRDITARIRADLSSSDDNTSTPMLYLQYINSGVDLIDSHLSIIRDYLADFYKSVAVNL